MKVSELFDKKVYDNNAQTVDEIALELGTSEATVRRMLKTKLDELERVWKMKEGKPVQAYRVKKK